MLQPRPLTRVDISIDTNLTWDDAFQFGDPADFTWNLNGLTFSLAIKADDQVNTPVLLLLTSAAGQIVVQDATNRIIQLNVPPATVRNALPPFTTYVYDFVMVNTGTGSVDGLMYGELQVNTGMTIVS